ncbi:hypothetical protein Vadar_016210 [Vaccinium darrowii]|nr:hypothetical protein Vadar_016210 [Vaccinium darrowii]
MKAQIENLAKQVKGKAPTMVEELMQNTNSPFTPEVMSKPLLWKFKMPHIDTFSGSTDPLDHLETYKNLMMLQASISNFKELNKSFVSYFIAGKKYSKPLTYLFTIRQGRRESLWDFTSRFTKESMQVEVVEDQVSIAAYIAV